MTAEMGNYAQESQNFVRNIVLPEPRRRYLRKTATKTSLCLFERDFDLYLLRVS